jgi:hypothetical protein
MSDKLVVKLREVRLSRASRQKSEKDVKRFLCSDIVQLLWSGLDSFSHREVAVLENLTKSGAGLFMGVPVPCGIEAQLFINDAQLAGRIRRCAFAGNGYIVEIELPSHSKASRILGENFVPEHLLDISLLDLD